MNTYFNYDDLSITMKPTGAIVFNKELIYRKMSKSFVMPQWIKTDIELILDDDVFRDVSDVFTIQKIINTKVIELNNVLVPVARANKLKNSNIGKYINFDNYFKADDIVITSSGFKPQNNSITETMFIDLERVYKNLGAKGFILEDNEKDQLINILNDKLVAMDKDFSLWNIIDNERVEELVTLVKERLVKYINEYLLSISTPIMLRYMLDNVAVSPYFTFDNGTKSIVYDEKRVFNLLDAMGYHIKGNESKLRDYINIHKSETEEEVAGMNLSDVEEDVVNNLSLYVNLSILNRIKFVSDNSIPIATADGLRYPEVITSQLELETLYVERCVEMLSYDNILEDLSKETGLPKYKVDTEVDSILEEVETTFKLLKQSGAHVDKIYEGVCDAYDSMLKSASSKAKRKFTQIKTNTYNTFTV